MAILRVREHVNPLSSKYQTPPSIPDWGTLYAQPDLPLHLDIGCARGRFVLQLAQIEPRWNYLGLEIRGPLVDQANQWRTEQGSQNLHYLSCNANNTLRPLLQSLPSGWLQRVTIQFPDPWFKKRHHKRRVVQPELFKTWLIFCLAGRSCFSSPTFWRWRLKCAIALLNIQALGFRIRNGLKKT